MVRPVIAVALFALVGCDADMKKRKVSQAQQILERMNVAVKKHAAELGAFPIGTSRQLPEPGVTGADWKGCCGGKSSGDSVDNKCPVSKDWAADPIWAKLGVAVVEPSLFRFKYESQDGKSFVVTAEGDLDCDGRTAAYTLAGSLDASGKASSKIEPPPPGEY